MSRQHDGDDDEYSTFELDSLLDSMGPSDDNHDHGNADNDEYNHYNDNDDGAIDEDDDDDDNNDTDSRGHMVDSIDPDAVDFTPFLKNHSGTAINYHDESHMLTEHHEKLHRKTLDQVIMEDLPKFSSSSTASVKTTKTHTTPTATTALRTCFETFYIQCSLAFRRYFFASPSKTTMHTTSNQSQEEADRTKYIVFGMLLFLLYVFLRHTLPPPLQGREIAKDGGGVRHGATSRNPQTAVTDIIIPENALIPLDFNQAYRNVNDLPLQMMDTPIYWHIPRSGGTTMKLILSMCMGRVVACEQGAGHELDDQLELLNKPFGNFANVDTSTPMGLQRAAVIGLVPSRIVDVIVTPHVRDAAVLFDTHHKGRLFTMMRHPVDRVVSLYYFLRMPDQEEIIGLNVRDMSLEEFAADISENWMVRSLTKTIQPHESQQELQQQSQQQEILTEQHLLMAKEILRTKFLIGLLDQKTESLRRMESYFGWKLPSRISQTCKNNMFYFEPQGKNIHDTLEPNSKEYKALAQRNQYDLELFEYAVQLFEQQGTTLFSKQNDKQ